MKKVILSSLVAATSLIAGQAKADLIGGGAPQSVGTPYPTGYNSVYLGATWNALQCSQTAATYGYQYYYFGPATVAINGFAYYIANACLGISGTNPGPGPGPVGGNKEYNVFVKSGVTASDCINAITFQFGAQNVYCYQEEEHLHCTSKMGGIKDRLEQVSCVAGVDPLNVR